jgi:hypothetical protein
MHNTVTVSLLIRLSRQPWPDLPLGGATDIMIIVLVDFYSLSEH